MSAPATPIATGRRQDLVSKVGRRLAVWFPTKMVAPRDPTPIVSFTFDDIPDSAIVNGAAALERHGVRGTFYIADGLCGTRSADWTCATLEEVAGLMARGHEIAAHTCNHPDMQDLDARTVQSELDRNAAALQGLRPGSLVGRNFAYPYGSTGLSQKRIVERRYRSARGTQQGLNRGRMDLGLLKAMRLYDHLLDAAAIDRLFAETVATRGWLIFYTHDVAERPSEHGCTPGLMETALAAAARHACPVMTVDAALDRLLG